MTYRTDFYCINDEEDELLLEALRLSVEANDASVSMLQRTLQVGYPRAARLIDRLHELGFIGPHEGSKPRKVLVTEPELQRIMKSGWSRASRDGTWIRRAEIISIGTELLVGQVMDTNAYFLSQQLSLLGIATYRHTVVGDNPQRLVRAIADALNENDLVITTGGLGPTRDDITAQVVARLANTELVKNAEIDEALDRRFGLDGVFSNGTYPRIPKGARFFHNEEGTAPGFWVDFFSRDGRSDKIVISLPGPPQEMQPMFIHGVKPALSEYCPDRFIHHFVRLFGIGESKAEAMMRDVIDAQSDVTIATYASPESLLFRVSQWVHGDDDEDRTGPMLDVLRERLGDYIYEIGDRTLPEVTIDLLREHGQTCAFAESCTGGLAASSMVRIAGASDVVKGGVVSYANDVKAEVLGVSRDVLATEGAVSEACARAMAEGCRTLTGADVAVSITGIAGPDGGTPERPVGTVWFATASTEATTATVRHFKGSRHRIQQLAAFTAIDLLRRYVLGL